MKEFMKSAEKHRMTIRVIRIMDGHNHVFISLTSWQSPSFAVHKLKGRSAKKLFDIMEYYSIYESIDEKLAAKIGSYIVELEKQGHRL